MPVKSSLFSTLFFLFTAGVLAQELSTWQTIQQQIFDRNCTSCHRAGTYFARQSGLVLTSDVAYSQLVNVAPANAAARNDGLLRVGTKGLESLYKSFLWEKINAPDQEHFYRDHPQYGSLMPLGAPPLTNGELEFIRRWIVAGAPQNGVVADRALLLDTTRFQMPAFAPLPKPVNGMQLHLGPFEVAPNFDRELFSYVLLDNPQDLFIERVEIVMRPGSHHFLLATFQENTPSYIMPPPNVIRDIRDANGNYIYQNLLPMQYHKFFAGTQWPLLNYHFPPGVALRLPANAGLDMNSHYANRSSTSIKGEIYANLYFAEPAKIRHVAEVLQLSNFDINLPPQQVTTLSKTFTFSERMHIFQLVSHAHEHMTEFKVEVAGGPRHGEVVYIAYDWAHPPILKIDPPLVLEPGQGLKLIVTYNNWTNRTLRFGLLSQDEMMILFGYFYKSSATAVQAPTASATPTAFALEQNYPNPFNPATTISYTLPKSSEVELGVYDVSGKLIAVLVRGTRTAGAHKSIWEAAGVAAGVYFVKMRAGDFQATRKILLLR
ncbi:MAG: T9SS type A sorting domain-containing protein [candidate division KSB1 bacterium]|nr:T9SS type A sorting domain-containing protein [candidate division KSB1 bacterium]MDZ7364646.1 T9SS type A sorting domain-containing protein [candidate division KSB1 bacterium]MDZ7402606.1 T9SS type A sorting domain-containing protein [candidate division KSB1 bacterium]